MISRCLALSIGIATASMVLLSPDVAVPAQGVPVVSPHTAKPVPPHSIREDMGPINTLLRNHGKVSFVVRLIPDGVQTTTTSKDPEIARQIRIHAREMKMRMEQGNIIRPNDPLFRELFRHHKEITFRTREIRDGVVESETSPNPQVVLLIRAHTQAVAKFVRDGMSATRKSYPLPPGYRVWSPPVHD